MGTSHGHLTYREIKLLSEEERYELDIYHRWDNVANRRKLGRLYGRLADRQDADILKMIQGHSVLDVGAGYGFFARHLIDSGFEVTAIDPNQQLIDLAREWFNIEVLPLDVHELPYPAQSFDTAVIREAVEHLDCEQAFRELDRVVRREIILFQTNLTPIVRLCRWMSGHRELREDRLEHYQGLLRDLGYVEQEVLFRDAFAIPLSGGTLTPQVVPPIPAIEEFTLKLDDWLVRGLRALGLDRYLCWRFVLRAQKPR